MRNLASIRQIKDKRPIENADRIEVCTVDGWEVVVKKDEFNIDDLIIYIEIDSIVPDIPCFEFLRDRGFKVKTIKLRKQISQGLIMPLSILPEGLYTKGQDVTDILGIIKYESNSEREANKTAYVSTSPLFKKFMKYKMFRKLIGDKYLKHKKHQKLFPDWIKKTDETRVQNLPERFYQNIRSYYLFNVTEKLDGQSATYAVKKKLFGPEYFVCSRNIRLQKHDSSSYWTISDKHDIKAVLSDIMKNKDCRNVVLQGEIIGNGIQGNKYNKLFYDFYAFNLIIDGYQYSTNEMAFILEDYGIKTVPIVKRRYQLPQTISELVKYATDKSVVNPKINREGLVLRWDEISFKVINPEFLLKESAND